MKIARHPEERMNKNALIRVVDDDEALLKAIKFSLELDGFSGKVRLHNFGLPNAGA